MWVWDRLAAEVRGHPAADRSKKGEGLCLDRADCDDNPLAVAVHGCAS